MQEYPGQAALLRRLGRSAGRLPRDASISNGETTVKDVANAYLNSLAIAWRQDTIIEEARDGRGQNFICDISVEKTYPCPPFRK